MSDTRSTVSVDVDRSGDVPVLTPHGVLDSHTYLQVRDSIVKMATDAPQAVIVDVDDLVAPTESAWSVLTSASWLIRDWPGIPLLVVAASPGKADQLSRHGIARYLQIHPTVDSAMSDLSGRTPGSRLRTRFRRSRDNADVITEMRGLVNATLDRWEITDRTTAASMVTTVLLENVLLHTTSDPDIRVEMRGDYLTIASFDASSAPAQLTEHADHAAVIVSGLGLLTALAHSWGNIADDSGKTVWATLGPRTQESPF